MDSDKKSVVIYGCAWETDKFLMKFPDVEIDYCIDDYLYGKSFHGYSIFKPQDKKEDLKTKYVLIFTDNIAVYGKLANILRSWGLKEFVSFIPYNLYGKKMALTWGNCHVEYIKSFLNYSKEFFDEYAFYNKKNLWDMKESELDEEVFAHCDLLVCQHIREENSLGGTFSSKNIENMLKKDTVILKFPNLFGLPEFLYPQTYQDNMFMAFKGTVRWYRDKNIDECINNNILDVEQIYSIVKAKKYSSIEVQSKYLEFIEKLMIREKQCNIHIFDYIFQHISEQKLFLDIEHPSKLLLGEIGNRILEYLGYVRLDSNLTIPNVYAHEVFVYPSIKEYFNMTWDDGDLKSDNISEKVKPIYMDIKEYIRQYCMIYSQNYNVKKKEGPKIFYSLKVENNENDSLWCTTSEDNLCNGTVGKKKKTVAIKIWLDESIIKKELDICYKLFLKDIGWTEYSSSGQECGTNNFDNYIQAISIKLVGDEAEKYCIKYAVHCQNIGWMPYVENGIVAGNIEGNLRLEAIKMFVQKRC